MGSPGDHQSAALRHALNGVDPSELSPEDRLEIIQAKLEILTSWGDSSPGFQPYGFRVGSWKAEFPRGISSKTRIIELTQLGQSNVPIAGTTRTTVVTTQLVVTLGKRFLVETRYNLAESDLESPHVKVEACGQAKLIKLLASSWSFMDACAKLNKATMDRVQAVKTDLYRAKKLRRAMLRTAPAPWRH